MLDRVRSAGLRVRLICNDKRMSRLAETACPPAAGPVEVYTAKNGIEGLLRLGQFRPNVLITDLLMPSMNGVEMIRFQAEAAG